MSIYPAVDLTGIARLSSVHVQSVPANQHADGTGSRNTRNRQENQRPERFSLLQTAVRMTRDLSKTGYAKSGQKEYSMT